MKLALFVGESKLSFGGMQTHMTYFVRHFNKKDYLSFIVYRYPNMVLHDCKSNKDEQVNTFDDLMRILRKMTVCFFNDGCWIDMWQDLRQALPDSMFIFRTGGNEFVKASYKDNLQSLQNRQKLWARLINSCMDFIISNSGFTTRRLVNQGIEEGRILLVRGGIDIDQCKTNFINRGFLRKRFDEEFDTQNKIIFGIVSRFEPFKGIIDVLSAFAEFRSNPEFYILIVGDGSEKNNIKEFCTNNFDCNQYCILNETDNISAMQYIAIADYYLNCSRLYEKRSGNDFYIHTETMGRSLYEAIYQYVPVIATDVGGIGELFDEFEDIGILLKDVESEKRQIIKSILHHQIQLTSSGSRYDAYGWKHIMENLYEPMFAATLNKNCKRVALCLDIDGTIYHTALSDEENENNLKKILEIFQSCEIIINSAANYEEILGRYQVFDDYKEDIVIISNCGKHLYFHGMKDIFWDNYMEGIPGIQEHIVEDVKDTLKCHGISVNSVKYIDKLYVNMKIAGEADPDVIKYVSKKLERTQYMITSNHGNVKIISKIVNKSAPIKYLRTMNKNIEYWIGAGNNVLDFPFLDICDVAYAVNYNCGSYHQICIDSNQSMSEFIELMMKNVGDYLSNDKTIVNSDIKVAG